MQGTPTHGNHFLVFLLGLTINLLAQVDPSGFIDYALKAIIGGVIWLLFKLLSDYIAAQFRGNQRANSNDTEEPENPNPDAE